MLEKFKTPNNEKGKRKQCDLEVSIVYVQLLLSEEI
jgi:hypothetical protein